MILIILDFSVDYPSRRPDLLTINMKKKNLLPSIYKYVESPKSALGFLLAEAGRRHFWGGVCRVRQKRTAASDRTVGVCTSCGANPHPEPTSVARTWGQGDSSVPRLGT